MLRISEGVRRRNSSPHRFQDRKPSCGSAKKFGAAGAKDQLMEKHMKYLAGLVLVVIQLFSTGSVLAQSYPTKPVRFIIGPGGDLLTRLLGQKLTDRWGQQVLVDQRPSAGGII